VASGDHFVAAQEDLRQLRRDLPGLACVDMESAAVAQVCYEYGVPCAVVRTISDTANEHAPLDSPRFLGLASAYSHGILKNLLAAQAGVLPGPHAPLRDALAERAARTLQG
jgi:adenosylhomocysteine nucleosidase